MSRERRAIRRATRGQALVEMGIVVVLLTFMVMGIVEVGFAFARTNMIVAALRDGARFGATLSPTLRDASGCYTGGGTTNIQNRVQGIFNTVGFTPSGNINVTQPCDGTTPIVTVQAAGTLNLIFNFIGTSVAVNRSVSFTDEGRQCVGGGAACP